MSEWISVKERLPEVSGDYLVAILDRRRKSYTRDTAYIVDGQWQVGTFDFYPVEDLGRREYVTHWMPLPPAPQTGGDDGKH